MDASHEATLTELWEGLLTNWQQESAHAAFLEAAAIYDALPFAARLYRGTLDDPERQGRAQAQLDKITVQALSMLEATRTPPSSNKRVMTWIAMGVSLSLIGWSIFAITR